jgi:hypothetical protein
MLSLPLFSLLKSLFPFAVYLGGANLFTICCLRCSTFLAKGFTEEVTREFTLAPVALLFTLVHKPDTSWLSKDASPL